MIALLVAAALQGSVAQTVQDVSLGISVRPETVTVGDHFVLTVRVRAPRGATLAFPVGPDTGGSIESVSSRGVASATPADSSFIEETASYRLVAWDTGQLAAGIGPVVVSTRAMRRTIPLNQLGVFVRSVLPRDTTLHIPKPARDIVVAVRPWWHWLLAALAVLALISLLVWWWIRRRRRVILPQRIDPFVHAEKEFARIDGLALIEAGERGRYVALNVEVLRDYLAARVPLADRSLTSTELVGALRSHDESQAERLSIVLSEADLIKFANRPVSIEGARRIALECSAMVRDVERAAVATETSARQKAA
ncbi:MAG: hypothetical protein ABR543_01295 [Gemmatimonadaceae bacterium]